jgi:protein SCO1/2
MPTFCPLMDRHFAAIQKELKSGGPKSVRLLSISIDPITDRPPVLKAHAQALGADPSTWTFLTGDRDAIDQFAMRFGLTIARDMAKPTDVTHTLRTAIVSSDGLLVKVYTGNSWTPQEVLNDLRRSVGAN